MSKIIPINPEKSFTDNNINLYMHCSLCLDEMPKGYSPQSWSMTQAGWTKQGLQVWCNRHNCNIIHIDFEGNQHPADSNRQLIDGK